MDEKLKATLQKIELLSKQNEEFANEMRKMFGKTSSAQVVNDEGKIDEIYEYCLEKVISKQAEDFYGNFPIPEIKEQLVEDFIRMERFKREDNFGDFCLAIYQQVEAITSNLCKNELLKEIANNMWNESYYVDTKDQQPIPYKKRYQTQKTIAQFVYLGSDKDNKPLYLKKIKEELAKSSAKDKIRITMYFVAYSASLSYNDYNTYTDYLSMLYDIYLCRNSNHRGESYSDEDKQKYEDIIRMKSYYFYKYIGVLTQFVDFVKKGYNLLPDLHNYSRQFVKNEKEDNIQKTPEKKVQATITSILASACFVKYESNTSQLPLKLFSKVKGKKQGDVVKLLLFGKEIKDVLLD